MFGQTEAQGDGCRPRRFNQGQTALVEACGGGALTPTAGVLSANADNVSWLLQLRVLGFGLLQDRDVGIGVFPQREEVFVSGMSKNAGGIGIRAPRSSRLQRIRTRHAQTRQGSGPEVPHDATVVENFFEFRGSLRALPSREIYFPANVCRIQAGKIGQEMEVTEVPCPSLDSETDQTAAGFNTSGFEIAIGINVSRHISFVAD